MPEFIEKIQIETSPRYGVISRAFLFPQKRCDKSRLYLFCSMFYVTCFMTIFPPNYPQSSHQQEAGLVAYRLVPLFLLLF